MKKKAFKLHRKRARLAFSEWTHKLGLGWWRVEVDFYDSEEEFRKADGESVTAARIWAKWQYLEANIAVNVPAVARMSDDELEYAIVHELCHALVNEMREGGIDHEERVVTSLAKAFIWTRDLTRGERPS